MATNPELLAMPIAENGEKNAIPETTTVYGQMSLDKGFPSETSLPLTAGGIAPRRVDFNGAYYLLSSILFYVQKGWQFQYDAEQAYFQGCQVIDPDDGQLYKCIADVAAGQMVPHSDTLGQYWERVIYVTNSRQPNTAYNVGDIVNDASLTPPGLCLECIVAGTTAAGVADFSSLSWGDTVVDGTVTWAVRRYIVAEGDAFVIGIDGNWCPVDNFIYSQAWSVGADGNLVPND